MNRIPAMLSRLSEQEARRLQRVFAPVVVGTHPSNTWADLCALPDGEIRVYGHDEETRFYLASTDCGFTWKRYDVEDNSLFCSGILNPHTGRWFNSYYVKGEEVVCSGYGYIDPAKVKYNTTFSLYSYTGDASMKAWFELQSSYGIIDTADAVDALISAVSGQGIDVFGFKYIKY